MRISSRFGICVILTQRMVLPPKSEGERRETLKVLVERAFVGVESGDNKRKTYWNTNVRGNELSEVDA